MYLSVYFVICIYSSKLSEGSLVEHNNFVDKCTFEIDSGIVVENLWNLKFLKYRCT